jgi:hypothetical protein
MKKLIMLCFCGLLFICVNGQTNPGYSENIKKAEQLYYSKDYINSAKTYAVAFALNDGKATIDDRYNAACSWALAGNKDSAFYHLFVAAQKAKYDNYGHITTDTDLNSLHDDAKWNELLAIVMKNKETAEANYIKPVVAILDSVYIEDQKYRKDIVQMIKDSGMSSQVVQRQLKLMNHADSVNLLKVTKILDEYGWLGFDKVGRTGALTIFLVIQHSPLEVQQKYLPMMREAVQKKQASAGNLALLEDRVALREGRKQIYGSQVGTDTVTNKNYLLPLEDPDNVDARRAQVGLGPLADYLKMFDMEWNPEAFKKQEAEREGKKD